MTLIRELAIGTDTSGPEYEFSLIGYAAAMRSGSVFASDALTGQIRKFDVLGRYRGDVGRVGSGPAEYRLVQDMAVVGDSLLVVYDPPNRRIVLFDTAGAYRGMFRVSGYGGGGPLTSVAFFSDGTLAVRTLMARQGSPGGGTAPTAFVRYRLDGEVLDTIRVPIEERIDVAFGTRNLGWRYAFPATTVFTLLPRGGIATAHTTQYRIVVAPASGPGFVIERSVPPVPLAGREREEWQALLDFMGRRTSAVRMPSLPRHKPFIRDLFADSEGRIWVEVYTQAVPREAPPRAATDQRPTLTLFEPNAYDVFDERGRYLGRVDLRPSSRLLAVLGNRLWVSEESEEDTPVLVRYRLVGAPAR